MPFCFINPWASYKPEDIPDLNPKDDDGFRDFIGGMIAWLLATLIWVLMDYLLFRLKVNGYISFETFLLLLIPAAIIYAALTIIFMKLAFKKTDSIKEKKKNNEKGR